MEDQSREARSRLYLLRVWTAPGPDGAVGYRGKLQPVPGEGSYCFTGEAELLALLASLFPGTDHVSPGPRLLRSLERRAAGISGNNTTRKRKR